MIEGIKWMSGGEFFVPKIPSMRIIDLARAMAPEGHPGGHRHPPRRKAS